MPRKPATDPRAVHEMHELHQAGATFEAVGKRFGISKGQVSKLFKAAGLQARPNRGDPQLAKQRVEDMYKLYREGATLEEVGAHHGGITRERVRQLFNNAGLQKRTRAKAHHLRSEANNKAVALYLEAHRENIVRTFRGTRNIEAISEEHDLSKTEVMKALKEALPPHEYRALRYRPQSKRYTDDELIGFLQAAGAACGEPLTVTSYEGFASDRHTTDG